MTCLYITPRILKKVGEYVIENKNKGRDGMVVGCVRKQLLVNPSVD